MDKEFLSFCIVVIQFFKGSKDLSDCAAHLLECLNFTTLLRDEFEKMLRVVLVESQHRGLNIRDYLEEIKNFNVESEMIEVNIDANQL